MSCATYELRFGTGNLLSGSYLNCGDLTPFSLSASGASGGVYGNINASVGSIITYAGTAASLSAVGGWTDAIAPWAAYVLTSAVSAV